MRANITKPSLLLLAILPSSNHGPRQPVKQFFSRITRRPRQKQRCRGGHVSQKQSKCLVNPTTNKLYARFLCKDIVALLHCLQVGQARLRRQMHSCRGCAVIKIIHNSFITVVLMPQILKHRCHLGQEETRLRRFTSQWFNVHRDG